MNAIPDMPELGEQVRTELQRPAINAQIKKNSDAPAASAARIDSSMRDRLDFLRDKKREVEAATQVEVSQLVERTESQTAMVRATIDTLTTSLATEQAKEKQIKADMEVERGRILRQGQKDCEALDTQIAQTEAYLAAGAKAVK